MSVNIEREFLVTARKLQISTHDLTFLTIAGTHVDGAFAAFPGFGLSTELSKSGDQFYNTNKLFEMFSLSSDPCLPKNTEGLYEIAKDLSKVISPLVSELSREATQSESTDKRMNHGYEIIEACTIGNMELVIGHNANAPDPYVCWYCSSGSDYRIGVYCQTLASAREELNERYQTLCYTHEMIEKAHAAAKTDPPNAETPPPQRHVSL